MKRSGRVKYIILIALLCLVSYACFILSSIIIEQDPSLEASVVCNSKAQGRVWLISYAGGPEANFRNQRYQIKSALNKCIDYYKPYNASYIAPEYQKDHSNILSQARGAGYWLWKPYIILKTLEEVPENDIVFYLDSGVALRAPIDSLVGQMGDHDILAFESFAVNKEHTKRDLLQAMDADDDSFLAKPQLQASFLLFRNTKSSGEFVKEWLKWCEDEKALTDTASKEENYPEFTEHRHDQAIFSILSYKHNNEVLVLPMEDRAQYFFHHRRRGYTESYPLSLIEHAQYNDGWFIKFLYYISLIITLGTTR